MGIFNKIAEAFPPSEHPSYIPMPDTEGCGDISPDVWREPPMPTDSALAERRLKIKNLVFRAAFKVPGWDEEARGPSPIPFYELSPEAVDKMPAALRLDYEAELASAKDPRSGPRIVVYVKPGTK